MLPAKSDAGFNNELSGLFENRGYSVDSCSNGGECLRRLSTQHYQLIILNITLPEIDGFSILSMLRKTIQTSAIMLMNNGAEEENQGPLLWCGRLFDKAI
ncbi:response regulator [Exilibacterium tricleocarpae]|uniref:Response regulator n=1 Tax=Exilibacterium tricleocarpae TaxID=2591008 RepID=A0A545TFT3_9GAMM|nr:response regulator [Exilibacterium tricleocarpae]